MTDIDNVQTIVDTAQMATQPALVERGQVYAVRTSTGVQLLDLTGPAYQDVPDRKVGTVTLADADSFVTYVGKHGDGDTEIYADENRRTVTAVLDAHTSTSARWEAHRAVLQLQHSPAWVAWSRINGKMLDQAEFAEFLEDNAADIHEPDAATMLEVAQSIQGRTKAEFTSGTVLANGARRLSYNETTQASAGERGQLDIPGELTLALPVFVGAEQADAVTARFRYRINSGRLQLGIRLNRPEVIVTTAFLEVVNRIAEGVAVPILRGVSN